MRSYLLHTLMKRFVNEGQLLPKWLVYLRACLFPIQHQIHKNSPYDPYLDVWTIAGIQYTGAALRALAEAEGETFKIERVGGALTFTRVSE